MEIPKISMECIMAQMESSARFAPDEFISEWIRELVVDNGILLNSVVELSEGFFPDPSNQKKGIAIVALVTRIIAAQIESNNLEEQFNGSSVS